MKLLIIEPWFCGMGHPAQSLINLASAIGVDARVEYLISSNGDSEFFLKAAKRLSVWGKVKSYAVTKSVGYSNTIRALFALWRMRFKGQQYQRIFFFDQSLFVLALTWPLFSLGLSVERISVLHLYGPKLGMRFWFARFVISRFLNRREVWFYLRTEELATAWSDTFKFLEGERIRHLPSLEIPDDAFYQAEKKSLGALAFGIIGQIRVGKGIEWLVPTFQNNPAIGKLTVAGEFSSFQSRERLSVLSGFDGFVNCFMSENEMLERAAEQDYLLMLYDVWDKRMESAILYLAARVNRPVVVYGDSWCGRMVRQFGCGVLAPVDHEETVDLLLSIPRRGSAEYDVLLEGMQKFRQTHSVKALRGKVVQELLG
jgi:hypothetical protein